MPDLSEQQARLCCVKCAQPSLIKEGPKAYRCQACGFIYFHNVAAAVCALIICNGQVLLVQRAQAPSQGRLDFPGGFVDYAESNEQALKRELIEELQLTIDTMQYLGSYPNQYLYQEVLYHTLDCFFVVHLSKPPDMLLQVSEVSDYQWITLSEVEVEQLAFVSGQDALTDYLSANESPKK